MSKQIAVVVRGCIELPPADDDESERKGRLRRFHPGELVTLLAADFLRLQRLGIVKALTP